MKEFDKKSLPLDNDMKHEAVISRIPTETLSHIFTFTLAPYRLNDEPAPWTIGAVCSRWRRIVISQPCFWVFIDLRFFQRERFTGKFRLEIQLSRSASLPLNVAFSTPERAFTSEDASLLQTIVMHVARWETLSMMGPRALYAHFHALMRDQFTLLRVLDVEMEYGHFGVDDGLGMDEDGVPLLVTFKDAPRLQQVTVNKIYYPCPLSLALPSSQVLQFSGSNFWGGHLRTLRSTTNLVSCSLLVPPETDDLIVQGPIFLPHLLRLSVAAALVLEYLETPALQELHCHYEPPLLPFLRRQRQLQKLVIHDPPEVFQPGVWWVPGDADAPDLTPMVEAATTVTTLALMLPLPAAFVRDLPNLDMVPALACLATRDMTGNFEAQKAFMHAVESRWKHGRLRCVKVSKAHFPWAPGILGRIELLQSQGMEFVVQSYSKIKDEIGPDF
ncbi:F-box domain-containing protein [Mycena sanguinolenta]|uniref:F-box domain-containing protein n=1 Tax=Mycena sanguinolenta TaxID=230812 RepID=A0A8H7CQE1_9AGAR|nr:F-box domain-containing protein [Mycena sanguinolenta]